VKLMLKAIRKGPQFDNAHPTNATPRTIPRAFGTPPQPSPSFHRERRMILHDTPRLRHPALDLVAADRRAAGRLRRDRRLRPGHRHAAPPSRRATTDIERRVVINSVGPVWEGNQVWLILGGGAIFAAWPQLYAVSFSGFYLAMFVILTALILRPVAFKFRSKRESRSGARAGTGCCSSAASCPR
jgi:hypothetical protein